MASREIGGHWPNDIAEAIRRRMGSGRSLPENGSIEASDQESQIGILIFHLLRGWAMFSVVDSSRWKKPAAVCKLRLALFSPEVAMDDYDALRQRLIHSLMTAEDFSYEAAEAIVEDFEMARLCPRCGSLIEDQVLGGTIWQH